MLTTLKRATVLAAFVATTTATGVLAQETATDPHHPDVIATETTPPAAAGEMAQQGQDPQSGLPGMMDQGVTAGGMMAGMMQPGMMDAMPMMRMHGHMMRIVFAIADQDGDGALSFEEVSAIQKRIFDALDVDEDDTVTPDELQSFMRD